MQRFDFAARVRAVVSRQTRGPATVTVWITYLNGHHRSIYTGGEAFSAPFQLTRLRDKGLDARLAEPAQLS